MVNIQRAFCTRCNVRIRRDHSQRWCTPCALEYQCEHRKSYAMLPLEEKIKQRARARARYAASRGRINRAECHMCGSQKRIELHHSDHTRPLDVTPMCAPCHRRTHKTS